MKKLFALIIIIAITSPICLAQDEKPEMVQVLPAIEINIMAVGYLDGGKIKNNDIAAAIIHFKNNTTKTLEFPLRPIELGKGKIKKWADESYRNNKEGNDFGFGYSSAMFIPQITAQFEDSKGNIIKKNEGLLIPPIPAIAPKSYQWTECLFSSPAKAGTYNLRFIIDNTKLMGDTGHNSLSIENAENQKVYYRKEILLENILVN